MRFLSDVKYSIDGVTFSEWVDLKIEQNGKELTNIKLECLVTQGSPPPLSKFSSVLKLAKDQCGNFHWATDDSLSIVVKSDRLDELNLQKCYSDAFETNLESKEYAKYLMLIKNSKTLFDKLSNKNASLKNYLQ